MCTNLNYYCFLCSEVLNKTNHAFMKFIAPEIEAGLLGKLLRRYLQKYFVWTQLKAVAHTGLKNCSFILCVRCST